MAIQALLSLLPTHAPIVIVVLISTFVYFLLRVLYRLSPFHPLSHIPGPLVPRTTSLYLTRLAWIGNECTTIHDLHQRYGPILRTGPNSVDVADGDALSDIYSAKGGFRKADFYGNFDIDGHKSIFSELVPELRAVRAKAVIGMFSTASLRNGKNVLEGLVADFVGKCENLADWSRRTGKPVNLLDLTRGLACDAVTGYLFGRAYGGVGEEKKPDSGDDELGMMSAGGMVDLFVAVGRFWYLPAWAFKWVDWFDGKFGEGSSKEVGASIDLVDAFVAGVVEDARKALEEEKSGLGAAVNGISVDSYPARLLSAGISISETRAQCKDLIFAGTDSTGMNLATIIFHLVKNPPILANVEHELAEAKEKGQDTDLIEIQALPWLRGTVKEGLRLSMANPSRLTRVVPDQGWIFKGVKFPAGTEVSCTPFELHLNPAVFEDPLDFNPSRWIDEGPMSKEMERDAIPFGLGPRQCIARNLATAELYLAVKELVESGVLKGAKPVAEKIEILEWFNSHVVGGKIEMKWT